MRTIYKSTDPRRIDLEGPVLVAHQAEFMPWLGFFSKAAMGDIYLILDDTQFKKKNFQNRNKIRDYSKDGWAWLSVPLINKDKIQMLDKMVFVTDDWKREHLKAIKHAYARAPFFNDFYNLIEDIYLKQKTNRLIDLNLELIKFGLKCFEVLTPVYLTSEINATIRKITGEKTDFIIDMCKVVGARVLVAGQGGKEYIEEDKFRNNDIQLVYQKFSHPVYTQMHGNFLPYMSFIDLLFNHGGEARHILTKSEYELSTI
jgi:hypothetical protein